VKLLLQEVAAVVTVGLGLLLFLEGEEEDEDDDDVEDLVGDEEGEDEATS
jgi:hypothetical protein